MDASVLFDQLLLADLQETMARLDTRVFAEMRSYIEPPELVLKIIQALLNILRPEGEYDSWKQCKKVKKNFFVSNQQNVYHIAENIGGN